MMNAPPPPPPEAELRGLRDTQVSVAARLDELRRTAELHEAMRVAADEGDVESVIGLLQRGVSVNAPDASGCSALHYACRAGHAHVVERCIEVGRRAPAWARALGPSVPIGRSAVVAREVAARHPDRSRG